MTDPTELSTVVYVDVRAVMIQTDPSGVVRVMIEQESGTTDFNLRENAIEVRADHTIRAELDETPPGRESK